MTKFKAGQSGNPTGRPKGAKDKRTALRELLVPHASSIVNLCAELAKGGDIAAIKICMDRLVSPIREEPMRVTIPKITGPDDCTKAQASVLNAVAAGEMLPSEGQVLSGLIDAQRRAYETSELSTRLKAIEEQLKPKGVKAP